MESNTAYWIDKIHMMYIPGKALFRSGSPCVQTAKVFHTWDKQGIVRTAENEWKDIWTKDRRNTGMEGNLFNETVRFHGKAACHQASIDTGIRTSYSTVDA